MAGTDLSGLRVGVFGKGGSGKSTVTVFLARALRELGHAVLVLDADSTNQGLGAALGADREPEPLLDYFGGTIFGGGTVTCPVDDPTPLVGAELELDDLPARLVARTPEGIELLAAGKLGPLGPGAGCDGPVAKIARDLRVTQQGRSAVALVDYKAGFEDAARGALTTLDWALAIVDPTAAALQMARHLARMVSEIRRGVPPATRHLQRPELADLAVRLFRDSGIRGVLAVLNRVWRPEIQAHLRAALDGSGAGVVAAFRHDPAVGEQWLRGERLDSERLMAAARTLACAIERVARPAAAPGHA